MGEKSKPQSNSKLSPEYARFRNAARASPLSGRHVPMHYTTPLDTQNLITAEEFQRQFIRNKPGNRYTDTDDVVEAPKDARSESPSTPVTATSGTATQRSETETSLEGSTILDTDDHAPTGW